MRAARRVMVAVLLAGCFTEVEAPTCYADGVAFLSERPDGARRPREDIPWSAVSDVCCDDSDPAAGALACRTWYRDNSSLEGELWQLAACAPGGYCYLDCRSGENCACVTARDCDGRDCVLVERSEDSDPCAAQGQVGDDRRCTVCEAP